MSLYQEQFSAATKAQVEAQLAFFTSLTGKAFESIEKIVELNMSAAKASLEESTSNVRNLLAAKDPQEFFSLVGTQTQPNPEKALAYSRHVSVILSGMNSEISAAAEAQVAEHSRKVNALVEEVSKNAPAGSEPVISLVKSAIASSSVNYEKLAKSTKQAVDTIEENIHTASAQLVQNVASAHNRVNAAVNARK